VLQVRYVRAGNQQNCRYTNQKDVERLAVIAREMSLQRLDNHLPAGKRARDAGGIAACVRQKESL
jgi:hypothetical protein